LKGESDLSIKFRVRIDLWQELKGLGACWFAGQKEWRLQENNRYQESVE
jgi:hypothetical protein